MALHPEPTLDVARARRYAAHVRIVIALVGLGLLAIDGSIDPHPLTAALGLAVIGVTGVVESVVRHQRWLRLEEALSCLAAVFILGYTFGDWAIGRWMGSTAEFGILWPQIGASILLYPVVARIVLVLDRWRLAR